MIFLAPFGVLLAIVTARHLILRGNKVSGFPQCLPSLKNSARQNSVMSDRVPILGKASARPKLTLRKLELGSGCRGSQEGILPHVGRRRDGLACLFASRQVGLQESARRRRTIGGRLKCCEATYQTHPFPRVISLTRMRHPLIKIV
jgi:hypothetical protein